MNTPSVNALGFYGNERVLAGQGGRGQPSIDRRYGTALSGLTRSVAVRYGARGVRANAVAPGSVRTAIWNHRVDADLAVFDREEVDDVGTYDEPWHVPRGIPYVIVNGQLVIDQGAHTEARPGRALRR